jgi:hypothetical protein
LKRSAPSAHFWSPVARTSNRRKAFSISKSPPQRAGDVLSLTKGFDGVSPQRTLAVWLCVGLAIVAAYQYGIIKFEVDIAHHDSPASGMDLRPAPPSEEEIALRKDLSRYLTQVMFYLDKDPKDARQSLEKLIRFVDRNPNLLDPLSATGLSARETYFAILLKIDCHTDLLREVEALIELCGRKLEAYEQRGILNLPLQRDVPLSAGNRATAERLDPIKADLTESEERKFVFQQLFKAYKILIALYLSDDSPVKNDNMAKKAIESLLHVLEAEFGPSFERVPMQGRAGSDEYDKPQIYAYIDYFRRRFQSNTSPAYSPEIALNCLRPVTEMLSSFESDRGISPCVRIHHLQSISNLLLDLACESAPEGLLTTKEDRQHLAEAERVQQRVLELAAAVEPSKRNRDCDLARVQGLVSLAKIAWRYGDEEKGDQELAKASQLANSINAHLYKEVIKRIEKDPKKTAMKDWEPVSEEECTRLAALDQDHRDKS